MNVFHYTVQTDKTITDAISTVQKNLQEEKFGVLWEFNVKETLENKGFGLDRPFVVLEVCQPKVAQEVLAKNRSVGYFLPCKIVIYEDDQGKTNIGLLRPTVLMNMLGDETLTAFAETIENTLKTVIDKSK